METLQELRQVWEKHGDQIAAIDLLEHPKVGAFISVIKGVNGYCVLRYFQMGAKWVVSKDLGGVGSKATDDDLLSYLEKLTA